MKTSIIEIEQLTKVYDEKAAVDRLSLTIEKGEIFGLLGPNGAGKSTTILMLLGLIEPTEGIIKVCGYNPLTYPSEVKGRVGYLPDNLGFYQNMTGLENIMFTASLNNLNKIQAEQKAISLLDQVGLSDAIHKKAGKYSRGMKQRLGLADVLIKDPEVIILDEPTLGIDPEGVREILQLIKQLNKEKGITVLLSSHHLHQVQEICDRVGIFVDGKLLAHGNIDILANKLLGNESFVIHVEAEPVDESLLQLLNKTDGVQSVEQLSDGALDIYCNSNLTNDLAKLIINQDRTLQHISKKHYGLDEIYHRYFEGRETSEIV